MFYRGKNPNAFYCKTIYNSFLYGENHIYFYKIHLQYIFIVKLFPVYFDDKTISYKFSLCFIEEKIPIHFIVKLFIIPFYMGKSYTFL